MFEGIPDVALVCLLWLYAVTVLIGTPYWDLVVGLELGRER